MTTKFSSFLNSRGVKAECELCGVNDWSLPEDVNTLMAQLPTYYAGTGLMTGIPTPATGIPVYVGACMNCGNVRLHAAGIVDQRRERPGPPSRPAPRMSRND